MAEVYFNNAWCKLTATLYIGDTTMQVDNAAPFGTLNGGDWFRVSVWNEVVKVTGMSGTGNTVWTVERELEGVTSGITDIGTVVVHQVTAGMLANLPQGPIGALGMQGEPGEDGEIGPVGAPGLQGITGNPGRDGFAIDGVDGEDGISIPGAQGIQGVQGYTGSVGIGLEGEPGQDGYPIPGPAGPSGAAGAGGQVLSITTDTSTTATTGLITVTAQVQDGNGANLSGIKPVQIALSDASYGTLTSLPLSPGLAVTTGIIGFVDSANRRMTVYTDASGTLVFTATMLGVRTCYANMLFGSNMYSTALTFTNDIVVTGYTQWLDARTLSGVGDGGAIGTWNDNSSNHNDTTQATGANKPIWRANGGISRVQFTPNQFVAAASRVCPLNNFTIFWVGYLNSGRMFGYENSGVGTSGLAFISGGTWVIRNGGSAFDVTQNGWVAGTLYILCLTVGATGGVKLYVNGSTVANVTNAGTTGYADAGVTQHVGCAGNTGSGASGFMYQGFMYPSELNTAERTTQFAFLNSICQIY